MHQAAAIRNAVARRLKILTGETVIRKDSFDFLDRSWNVPGRQERRATGKTQKSQKQHSPRYVFHASFSNGLKMIGAVGDITTADNVYAKFRLWQFFGKPMIQSLSA